jgi:hypothetical protein
MSQGKSGAKLLIYGIVLFVLLFNLIKLFITGTSLFFRLELFGLLFLVALTFIGFLAYHSWGEHLFFFIFLLYLSNLALIWSSGRAFHLLPALVAVFGLILSVPRKSKAVDIPVEKPKVQVIDIEPLDHSVVLDKTVDKKVTHSPGKYVASKRSNIYHEPKCDWAKKIKVERRVWFELKEDAWEKGLKAHQCVE